MKISSSGLLSCFAVAIAACSSSGTTSSSSGGTTDSGTTTDGGTTTTDSGTSGTTDGGATLNGCTTFSDKTDAAAVREIPWDLTVGSNALRCMTVKVGQKVKWNGTFASHPLKSAGGDSPNPISSTTFPNGEITFATAGSFGYVCDFHPSMTGAIKVVP